MRVSSCSPRHSTGCRQAHHKSRYLRHHLLQGVQALGAHLVEDTRQQLLELCKIRENPPLAHR